jgi:hypothetical protein
MDGLSAAASVIAVFQLSSEVVKYINAATDAIKEPKCLRDEVREHEFILQQLKDEADDSEKGQGVVGDDQGLGGLDAPLGRL